MSAAQPRVRLKRAYDSPEQSDGLRVLIDGLWPRGLSKQKAAIDVWLKEIAPTTELRKWYGHEVDRWSEFRQRYRKELHANTEATSHLISLCHKGPVTLVFSAHDEPHSNAHVLFEFLEESFVKK